MAAGLEPEIREIRRLLETLNRRLDALIDEGETRALMRLSEDSLGSLMSGEPDLYTRQDLKKRYSLPTDAHGLGVDAPDE